MEVDSDLEIYAKHSSTHALPTTTMNCTTKTRFKKYTKLYNKNPKTEIKISIRKLK